MQQGDNLPERPSGQRQEQPVRRGILPWDSEEQIGSLLKMTSMSMRKRIEKALRPLGLTQQQGMTLRILLHNPGSTHSDLERILRIEKPSVTNLISVMERNGWVVRRKNEQDARFKQIFLTPEGEALAVNIAVTVEQTKAKMAEALSAEEAQLLKTLLKKLRKACEEEPLEEEKL